jgi:hypothetical protein
MLKLECFKPFVLQGRIFCLHQQALSYSCRLQCEELWSQPKSRDMSYLFCRQAKVEKEYTPITSEDFAGLWNRYTKAPTPTPQFLKLRLRLRLLDF